MKRTIVQKSIASWPTLYTAQAGTTPPPAREAPTQLDAAAIKGMKVAYILTFSVV